MLRSYNLYSTVHFATRIHNNSITAIGITFIDKVKYENYSTHPVVNRLSDHDAQIITMKNITVDKRLSKTESIRKFKESFIFQFAINLSYENWDIVFIEEDVSTVFNNFLDICLRVFNSSFQLQKIYSTHNNNPWITTGIKTSCQHKRELYLISRDSNNSKLNARCKACCLILLKVIKAAEQLYYNSKVKKPNNKTTTWEIQLFVSQYVLSRILCVVINKSLFIFNSENETKSRDNSII